MRQNSNSYDNVNRGLARNPRLSNRNYSPNIRPIRNYAYTQNEVPIGMFPVDEMLPPSVNSAPNYMKSSAPLFYNTFGNPDDLNQTMPINTNQNIPSFNTINEDTRFTSSFFSENQGFQSPPTYFAQSYRLNYPNSCRQVVPVINSVNSIHNRFPRAVINMNNRHQQTISAYDNFPGRVMNSPNSLNNHGNPLYYCRYCEVDYGCADLLKNHYLNIHRDNIYDLRDLIPLKEYLLCKCIIMIDQLMDSKIDKKVDMNYLEMFIDELQFSLKTRQNIDKYKRSDFKKEDYVVCCNIDKDIFEKRLNDNLEYMLALKDCISTLRYIVPSSYFNYKDIKQMKFDIPIDINLQDYPERPAFFFITKIDKMNMDIPEIIPLDKSCNHSKLNINNKYRNEFRNIENNINSDDSSLVPLSYSVGCWNKKVENGRYARLLGNSQSNVNDNSLNKDINVSNNMNKSDTDKKEQVNNIFIPKINDHLDYDKNIYDPNRASPRFGKACDSIKNEEIIIDISNRSLNNPSHSKSNNANSDSVDNSKRIFRDPLNDELTFSLNDYPYEPSVIDLDKRFIDNIPPSKDTGLTHNDNPNISKNPFTVFNAPNDDSRQNSRGNSRGLLHVCYIRNIKSSEGKAVDLNDNQNVDIISKDINNDAPNPVGINRQSNDKNIDKNKEPLLEFPSKVENNPQNSDHFSICSSPINNNEDIDKNKDDPNSSSNNLHENNNNYFRLSLEELGPHIRNLGKKNNRRFDSVIGNDYENSCNDSLSGMSSSSSGNLSKSKKKNKSGNGKKKAGEKTCEAKGGKKKRKKVDDEELRLSSDYSLKKNEDSSEESKEKGKKKKNRKSGKGKK